MSTAASAALLSESAPPKQQHQSSQHLNSSAAPNMQQKPQQRRANKQKADVKLSSSDSDKSSLPHLLWAQKQQPNKQHEQHDKQMTSQQPQQESALQMMSEASSAGGGSLLSSSSGGASAWQQLTEPQQQPQSQSSAAHSNLSHLSGAHVPLHLNSAHGSATPPMELHLNGLSSLSHQFSLSPFMLQQPPVGFDLSRLPQQQQQPNMPSQDMQHTPHSMEQQQQQLQPDGALMQGNSLAAAAAAAHASGVPPHYNPYLYLSLPPYAQQSANGAPPVSAPFAHSSGAVGSAVHELPPLDFFGRQAPPPAPGMPQPVNGPPHHSGAPPGTFAPGMPHPAPGLFGSGVVQQPSMCRFFASGACSRGADCNYAHIGMQTKGMLAAAMRAQGQQPNERRTFRGRGGKSMSSHLQHQQFYGMSPFGGSPSQHLQHMAMFSPYASAGGPPPPHYDDTLQSGLGSAGGHELSGLHSAMWSDKDFLSQQHGMHMQHMGLPSMGMQSMHHSHTGSAHHSHHSQSGSVVGDLSLNCSLDELHGRVVQLARDQYGCRLLQRLLDDNRPGLYDIVYAEALPHLNDLMTDPFGNYLCQKLIEHAGQTQVKPQQNKDSKVTEVTQQDTDTAKTSADTTQTSSDSAAAADKDADSSDSPSQSTSAQLKGEAEGAEAPASPSGEDTSQWGPMQRLSIIERIAPDLVSISLNLHGTRAIQKLIESISAPKEVQTVVAALSASVIPLIKDLNGNHVIQRCLHHLSPKQAAFIYSAVSRQVVSVATHKHGCCVLQRCIDYAEPQQKQLLIQEITQHTLELVQDPYANYVIQYVFDLNDPVLTNAVIQRLIGHVGVLSVQKFSSNVIEKCLELSNDKVRGKLVDELIDAAAAPRLLSDPFANYVIQKALSVAKKSQLDKLVAVIKPNLYALRNTAFGKRIMSKILKRFPECDLTPQQQQHHHVQQQHQHTHHSSQQQQHQHANEVQLLHQASAHTMQQPQAAGQQTLAMTLAAAVKHAKQTTQQQQQHQAMHMQQMQQQQQQMHSLQQQPTDEGRVHPLSALTRSPALVPQPVGVQSLLHSSPVQSSIPHRTNNFSRVVASPAAALRSPMQMLAQQSNPAGSPVNNAVASPLGTEVTAGPQQTLVYMNQTPSVVPLSSVMQQPPQTQTQHGRHMQPPKQQQQQQQQSMQPQRGEQAAPPAAVSKPLSQHSYVNRNSASAAPTAAPTAPVKTQAIPVKFSLSDIVKASNAKLAQQQLQHKALQSHRGSTSSVGSSASASQENVAVHHNQQPQQHSQHHKQQQPPAAPQKASPASSAATKAPLTAAAVVGRLAAASRSPLAQAQPQQPQQQRARTAHAQRE